MCKQYSKSERKLKGQYTEQLKQFMREYGYGELCKRIIKPLNAMIFDGFIFISQDHRNRFWQMYNKWLKHTYKRENGKIAVIYILSAKSVFRTVLTNYVSNPLFSMPIMIEDCAGEENYTLYQAAKLFAGMETGLKEEDLSEDEIIDDKSLAVILSAKFIQKYGIYGYARNRAKHHQSEYINKSARYSRNSSTYVHNGKSIRIRK